MDSWTRESIEKYVKELTGEEISYSTPAPEAFSAIVRALRAGLTFKEQLSGAFSVMLNYAEIPGGDIPSLLQQIERRASMAPLPWTIREGHKRLDDGNGNIILDLDTSERDWEVIGDADDLALLGDCVSAVPILARALQGLQKRLEIAESFIPGVDGSSYSRTILEAKL